MRQRHTRRIAAAVTATLLVAACDHDRDTPKFVDQVGDTTLVPTCPEQLVVGSPSTLLVEIEHSVEERGHLPTYSPMTVRFLDDPDTPWRTENGRWVYWDDEVRTEHPAVTVTEQEPRAALPVSTISARIELVAGAPLPDVLRLRGLFNMYRSGRERYMNTTECVYEPQEDAMLLTSFAEPEAPPIDCPVLDILDLHWLTRSEIQERPGPVEGGAGHPQCSLVLVQNELEISVMSVAAGSGPIDGAELVETLRQGFDMTGQPWRDITIDDASGIVYSEQTRTTLLLVHATGHISVIANDIWDQCCVQGRIEAREHLMEEIAQLMLEQV